MERAWKIAFSVTENVTIFNYPHAHVCDRFKNIATIGHCFHSFVG